MEVEGHHALTCLLFLANFSFCCCSWTSFVVPMVSGSVFVVQPRDPRGIAIWVFLPVGCCFPRGWAGQDGLVPQALATAPLSLGVNHRPPSPREVFFLS